jgi:hypothetical protein
MKTLGLISEGITDQVVIANLLQGYFDTGDVELEYLEPLRDATDQSRIVGSSGWYSVVEYISSSKFKEAFQFLDYVIVQIDTDVCEERHYEVSRRENGIDLTPHQLLLKVQDKIRLWISEEIFETRKNQIVLAVAVDSLECWLLPLYYEKDKAKRSKTVNCLNTLNQALNKTHKFTIGAKDPYYYKRASAGYRDNKTLRRVYKHNLSLEVFIDNLDACDFNSDDD